MSAARRLLDVYWDGALPVKPVAIGSALSVDVFRRTLELGQAGQVMLDPDVKGRARIVINAEDDLIRQRFAIAHMLGHLVLGHLERGGVHRTEKTRHFLLDEPSREESEANRFALELLMPEDALEVALRAGYKKISELAGVFAVSEVALVERLKALSWISSYDCMSIQTSSSSGRKLPGYGKSA